MPRKAAGPKADSTVAVAEPAPVVEPAPVTEPVAPAATLMAEASRNEAASETTGPTIVDTTPATAPGPRAAITRSASHVYTYEGVAYPGVTGILKVLDKSDALMNWAARNTAEAALSQIDNLASLRAGVGDEGVIKALTARSAWKRDEAANLGTSIHHIADLVVHGQPTPSMTPTVAERVAHYVEWWQASGWRLRLSEAAIVHPGIGYGGTLDLLAYDRDDKTVLVDVKTGKAIYLETVLQLAAYGMAPLICPPASPVVYPMPPVDRYVVLHVTAEGVREVEMPVGQAEREAFADCARLARWHVSMKGKRF